MDGSGSGGTVAVPWTGNTYQLCFGFPHWTRRRKGAEMARVHREVCWGVTVHSVRRERVEGSVEREWECLYVKMDVTCKNNSYNWTNRRAWGNSRSGFIVWMYIRYYFVMLGYTVASVLFYLSVYACLQKRKLVKWCIAPLFVKSSDLHRILTPCRSIQITAFISEDESISSCSHLRLLFFGTHGERLHNPLQSRAPHGPFLWSGPDPSGALAGATLLWWGPSLWSARPFVRGCGCWGGCVRVWGSRGIFHPQKRNINRY